MIKSKADDKSLQHIDKILQQIIKFTLDDNFYSRICVATSKCSSWNDHSKYEKPRWKVLLFGEDKISL